MPEKNEYRNPFREILSGVTDHQPIHVYFTGDDEGPDRFGIVYDTEDEALESAGENDLQVWRVPVVPNWDAAEHIESAETKGCSCGMADKGAPGHEEDGDE